MQLTRADARQTALCYLLMGLPGVPSLMYLPKAFIVRGDGAATAQRIIDATTTYRLIVLGALVSVIGFLVLAWRLYRLFEDVDPGQARLLVIFVVASATLGAVDVICLLTPLALQSGAAYLNAFTKPQLDAMTLGSFHVRDAIIYTNESLWGLWLLPFGILVIKSGFIPKLIGWLLILGCVAWVVLSAQAIAFPHAHSVQSIVFPLTAPGELSILLWLIFKSITLKSPETRFAYAR